MSLWTDASAVSRGKRVWLTLFPYGLSFMGLRFVPAPAPLQPNPSQAGVVGSHQSRECPTRSIPEQRRGPSQ